MENRTSKIDQRNGYLKSHGIALDQDVYNCGIRSTRFSRQSHRILQYEKESKAQECVRCQRQMRSPLEAQLNPIEDNNAPRITLTANKLQLW